MFFFYILTLFHINLKYCKQDDGENMGCLSLPSSRFNKCLHVVKLASDIFKEIKCKKKKKERKKV